MNSESLLELLRLLRDLEVFRVAIAIFPTRLNEIQMSPDLRAWIVRETTLEKVVEKLPSKVVDRLEAGGFDLAAQLAVSSVVAAVAKTEDAAVPSTADADLKWTPTPVLPPWKTMLTDPVALLFGEVLHGVPSVLRKRGMAHVDRFEALDWSQRLGAWSAEIMDEARFEVWANPIGRHSCTCMDHADHDMCEHVAGFLMRLVREAMPPQPELVAASHLPVVNESRLGKLEFVPEPATGDLARILERMSSLANTLEPLRAEGDNPRVRVVYVLVRKPARIVQRSVECGERMDLVPQTQTLSKDSGWTLDDVDLRKVLGGRLDSNPPKYVSEIDVQLIGACDTLPSGAWDTGINAFLWQSTLRKAALTGRLIDEAEHTLSVDERLWKWEPQLVERDGTAEFHCRVRSLDADGEVLELSGDVVVFGKEQDALVKNGSRLLCLDPRTPAALLDPVVPRFKVPVSQMPRLRRELRLFALAGAGVPQSYLPRRLRESPQPRLRVEVQGETVVLTPVPWYPSLGEVSDGAGGVVAFTTTEGELVELERDRPAEAELCRKLSTDLEGLGMTVVFDGGPSVVHDPESLRRLALGSLDKLWTLGWIPVTDATSLDRWKKRKGVFRASLKASGLDWFELGGVVDFDGFEVPLSQLVGRSGSIVLDDGSMAEIPQKLLRRLEWMKTLGTETDEGIRLKAEHATLAQDLMRNELAEMVDVAHWTSVLDRLQLAEEVPAEPPASLVATLRPYQLDGLTWMQSLRNRKLGGILADDMGLGKTVQVIGHLCRLFEREPEAPPVLVVAPASVVGNWVSELTRFAPHMQTRLLHGADRGDLIEAPITGPTIFVTTYGILPRETEWTDATEFSVLVLDESQTVRNPATVAHKTVAMIRAQQKLCLTGTPIENSIADLWAQFAVLNPGLLGPLDEFMEQFDAPPGEAPDLSRLRTLTAPFWLRRTKDKVASELPARQDIELGIDLDPKQMSLYNRQLQEFQRNLLPVVKEQGLENGARFEVLTALLRLRQIACAPELAGHQGPASKLDVLLEKLTEDVAEGHKAIVFSSFTSLLDLVGKRLAKESIPFLRIDGSTPAKERTRLVERFQKKDREDVILVSLKAGGAGINLTAADYVFLLDPWWNPAAEEQAAARAHRIGQTRPVTVYRMVARGTIEERVLELSRSKAALARDVFDAGESGGAALTAEVVAQLLG